MGASMLFALALASPATAQREEQFSAWCYTYGPARASDAQVIEGCSAVIAAGAQSAEKLSEAYSNRGTAYVGRGDYRRAIDDYGEALKRKPGEAILWDARCHFRAVVGDLQAALADCNESLRLQPSIVVFGTRGFVLLKLGRFDEAIAAYERALEINANDREAAQALDRLYTKTERWGDLTRLLEDLLQRGALPERELVGLRFRMAEIEHDRRGDREAALEHLRTAFAGEPATREWARTDSDLDSLRDDPLLSG
jgi:tetratricopeptide (TPR) repeat protein